MVGIVFVSHINIGQEMINVAETILGRKFNNFRFLEVPFEVDVSKATKQLEEKIEEVDQGEGVLLLTDFFGGTPSNICTSILSKKKNLELVYGTNLAMVIKLSSCCDKYPLEKLAEFIKGYGIDHINLIHGQKITT